MSQQDDAPGSSDRTMSADGLPPLRDVIRIHGLSARKSLSQNFLLDMNLTRRIARLGGPLEGRTIVEIGPGPGGLTRALLTEGAHQVIAIERDDRCLPALQDISERWPGKLHVISGDALAMDWRALIAPFVAADSPKPAIVANLPYGIATKLLVGWLESGPWPPWYSQMVLMFQKEVAERIVAPPGSKTYGRLAVLAQWRCEAEIMLSLSPKAFVPPPKVSSAVVRLIPRPSPAPACNVRTLSRVTAAVFGQRRKMLRVSLKQVLPDPEPILARAGLAPELRGERVTVADFATLARLIDGLTPSQ